MFSLPHSLPLLREDDVNINTFLFIMTLYGPVCVCLNLYDCFVRCDVAPSLPLRYGDPSSAAGPCLVFHCVGVCVSVSEWGGVCGCFGRAARRQRFASWDVLAKSHTHSTYTHTDAHTLTQIQTHTRSSAV